MVDRLTVWRQQEIANFHLLNGKEFLAFSGDEDSVWLECLPGSDLDTLNHEGRLEPGMFYAAGLEFRRVHGLFSPRFRGPWSHGDPNFGNVVFDEDTQRARLIDFETVHIETLSADVRHADDIASFSPRSDWWSGRRKPDGDGLGIPGRLQSAGHLAVSPAPVGDSYRLSVGYGGVSAPSTCRLDPASTSCAAAPVLGPQRSGFLFHWRCGEGVMEWCGE